MKMTPLDIRKNIIFCYNTLSSYTHLVNKHQGWGNVYFAAGFAKSFDEATELYKKYIQSGNNKIVEEELIVTICIVYRYVCEATYAMTMTRIANAQF